MTGSTSRDAILLERRYAAVFGSLADDEIASLAGALGEDLRDHLARALALPAGCFEQPDTLGGRIREAMRSRRAHLDAGVLLAEPAVEATIEVLGDRSDDPSLEDLQGVLPDLVERFGLVATRLMVVQYSVSLGGFRKLAATDERFAIPSTTTATATPASAKRSDPDPERDAIRSARAERKARDREQRARAEEQRRSARRGR